MEKSRDVNRYLVSRQKLVKLVIEPLNMDRQSQSNAIYVHVLPKRLLALKSSAEFMESQIDLSQLYHAIVHRTLYQFALGTVKLIHQRVSQSAQDFTKLNLSSDLVRVKIHANVMIVHKELSVSRVEMSAYQICIIHVLSIDVVSFVEIL